MKDEYIVPWSQAPTAMMNRQRRLRMIVEQAAALKNTTPRAPKDCHLYQQDPNSPRVPIDRDGDDRVGMIILLHRIACRALTGAGLRIRFFVRVALPLHFGHR